MMFVVKEKGKKKPPEVIIVVAPLTLMGAVVLLLWLVGWLVGRSVRGGSSLCSVADFVLDISMIHAWYDGWPGGSQNLY